MLERLIDLSLKNRLLVVLLFAVALAVSGLPGLESVRSVSKFGLSQVVATFSDAMPIYDSRQLIMERLASVELPAGIDRPELVEQVIETVRHNLLAGAILAIAASLLSLGAVDFGILVFLPVLTLQGVEGKMFKPMAWTFIFALLGALRVAVLLNPILSWRFLPKHAKEHEGRVSGWLKSTYQWLLLPVLRHRLALLSLVLVLLAGTAFLGLRLGGEFLPLMSEGSLVASVVRLAGVSIEESVV